MKTNITLSVCVFFLLSFSFLPLHSQEKIVETQYYKNIPELGGDVVIKSSTRDVKGEKSYTSFEIEAKAGGSYNLNFWLMPSKLKDGSYSSYDVLVNGKSAGKITPVRGNWQSIGLDKAAKVTLRSGTNTVSVLVDYPDVAEVEFVRLSTDVKKAVISSSAYDEYLEKLQRGESEENGLFNVQLSDITADAGVALDSKANYLYYPNVNFKYTYYTSRSFTAGQQVFISTNSATLHVIEFFSYSNPDTYSWVNKSFYTGSAYLGTINITIPVTGTYYIRLRSAINGVAGVANININGQSYFENVALNSTGFRIPQGGDGLAYSTFTTNLTGDARLWLERGTSIPGRTVAFNDDWAQGGLNSRIRLSADKAAIHGVQLSTYSASNPTGKCDLYVKCMDGAIYPYFPNLNSLYDIQSAPIDPVYNAFTWAAGINLYWYEPTSQFDEFWVENDPLASLHMFLLTPKYDMSPVYSTIGATQSNSVIDVRGGYNGSGNLIIKGASIKNGADNHPHGFAWETKFGKNLRSFHPRASLEGGSYDNTIAYFRRVGSGILLAEAIANGSAVLEHVAFSTLENNIINAQKNIIPTAVKNTFNTRFEAWKATNDINSATITDNSEFNSLLSYCLAYPGTAYLVFEKLGEGDFDASYLVDKLTLVSIDNITILEDVKEVGRQRRIRSLNNINHVDTVVSPYANAMKYVKNILTGGGAPLLLGPSGKGMGNPEGSQETGIRYSNEDSFTVINNTSGITIDFSLADDAIISLNIMDLKGRVVETLLQGKSLSSGSYNYTVNLQGGIYLVNYTQNGNANIKKVIVNN